MKTRSDAPLPALPGPPLPSPPLPRRQRGAAQQLSPRGPPSEGERFHSVLIPGPDRALGSPFRNESPLTFFPKQISSFPWRRTWQASPCRQGHWKQTPGGQVCPLLQMPSHAKPWRVPSPASPTRLPQPPPTSPHLPNAAALLTGPLCSGANGLLPQGLHTGFALCPDVPVLPPLCCQILSNVPSPAAPTPACSATLLPTLVVPDPRRAPSLPLPEREHGGDKDSVHCWRRHRAGKGAQGTG